MPRGLVLESVVSAGPADEESPAQKCQRLGHIVIDEKDAGGRPTGNKVCMRCSQVNP